MIKHTTGLVQAIMQDVLMAAVEQPAPRRLKFLLEAAIQENSVGLPRPILPIRADVSWHYQCPGCGNPYTQYEDQPFQMPPRCCHRYQDVRRVETETALQWLDYAAIVKERDQSWEIYLSACRHSLGTLAKVPDDGTGFTLQVEGDFPQPIQPVIDHFIAHYAPTQPGGAANQWAQAIQAAS